MTASLTDPKNYRERSVTLRVSGIEIPAAITEPESMEPASAVLLVPGSLFCDVNGDFPVWHSRPRVYAYLAEQLAARGHVVYRFAKLGPETGSVVVDAAKAADVQNWPGRVVIARAALAHFREALAAMKLSVLPTILAGHSEGAVVVSLTVHDEPSIRGVVLLSGPSVGLLDIMREQMVATPPSAAQRDSLEAFDAVVAHIRRGEPTPDELKQREGAGMLASMDARGREYMRAVDAADPALAIASVSQPVLIIQGGRDESVRPHHAQRLREARGGHPTTSLLFPELHHMYKNVPEGVVGPAALGSKARPTSALLMAWTRGSEELSAFDHFRSPPALVVFLRACPFISCNRGTAGLCRGGRRIAR